jgi:hypothetical protein
MMQEMTTHMHEPFTALDRCDRCGSQAKVEATMHTGALLLCGHHFKHYKGLLEESALAIYSEMEW